ncbi:OmpA family protein [Streptomyces sp. KR80]|uniref:OmpA family protein n=1 Tax=Streptomyces sp. KR80 TaxID=3457426 RepID=UPI003FD25BC2
MNRHTITGITAMLLLALGGSTGPAMASGAPPETYSLLRPGKTLAPPEIKNLRPFAADIASESDLAGGRREDTTQRVKVTLGARILFGKDSARLSQTAIARLGTVADEIKRQKARQIRVYGYTDNLGSAAHGDQLSRERAEAVRQILAKELGAGVAFDVRGYGERNPIASNETEAGREANRRVTISFKRTS